MKTSEIVEMQASATEVSCVVPASFQASRKPASFPRPLCEEGPSLSSAAQLKQFAPMAPCRLVEELMVDEMKRLSEASSAAAKVRRSGVSC